MLVQVQIKDIEADIQKKMADLELQREKMVMEDDRKRDELEADILMKTEELKAIYGTQINVEKIKGDLANDREVLKSQAEVIKGAIDD